MHKNSHIGLVIGTYGSVPYVHLQLEARKRYYPEVPCLIHDDGSDRVRELVHLAIRYGADLHRGSVRLPTSPPGLGDLSAFVQGLIWAKVKGLATLVKFSRRWLVLRSWTEELLALPPCPTHSSYCTSYGFGFRSECLAMTVSDWFAGGFLEDARGRLARADLCLPEMYLHHQAQKLCPDPQPGQDHPFGGCLAGYQPWYSMLGTDRHQRRDRQLWHDSASPAEYWRLAKDLGIDCYRVEDFERLD